MKKGKYSFFSNIVFMWKEHWAYDKLYLFLPVIKIPSTVGVALIGMLLPKIVLDALTIKYDLLTMCLQIAGCVFLLILLNLLSTKIDNSIQIHANKFFSLHSLFTIAQKKMDMDYELFSSPHGKVAAKKAQNAVQGNVRQGIVSFFLQLTEVLTNFLGFTSFLAILLTLNPWIIFFLLLSYGIDGIIALWMEKQLHKMKDEEAEVQRKTQYIAHRTSLTSYAKDIRIYSLTNWLKAVRQLLLQQELSLTSRRERLFMLQLVLEGLLLFLRDGLSYTYLIYRMIQDPTMSIGTFSVYFAAIAGFGTWLSNMVVGVDALVRANLCVTDYRAFMDIKDKTRVPDGVPAAEKAGPHSIRLENVTYQYPESNVRILDHITMEIKAGEALALVGINGAGKTTLVKLICGLLLPTSGDIYLDDINIKKIDREEYFKLFSAVFQDLCILPVSIKENITFETTSSSQSEEKLSKALDSADMTTKIKTLARGTDTRLMKQFNKEGVEFSGGELQKLLLARAIYKEAPILILDEPTAALDPIAENKLYLKYHELTAGKTSIYISHRLSSTRFCDRILLLEKGQIIESGTHAQLMAANGQYARMFQISSKYYVQTQELGEII